MLVTRNVNLPLVKSNDNTPTEPVRTHVETLPSLSYRPQAKGDPRDYEPDQIWKDEVTNRIDVAFESLLNDTKKTHRGRSKEEEMGYYAMGLRKKSWLRFEEEWTQVIAAVGALKKREYDYKLAEERSSRRIAISELKIPVPEHGTTTPDLTAKWDIPDCEPAEQWKMELRKRIDAAFEHRVSRAKEQRAAQLRRAAVTQEDRQRFEGEYNKTMGNINSEKWEQYRFELAKERSSRLWASQSPTDERRHLHPPLEPPPKPLQQPQPPVIPLKNFRETPRPRSPRRQVTIEDIPDDESIRSYLPNDGPILDLRVKPMDPPGAGMKRQGPTQTPRVQVGPERNPIPRTIPREDTPQVKIAKTKMTEAEIRFRGRKIPELNNIYEFWTPPELAQVVGAGPGQASQNRTRHEFGQEQQKWGGRV